MINILLNTSNHIISNINKRQALQKWSSYVGMGTIFWLGEQKLVKNNQDIQIQNITVCNMYFSKKVYAVYKYNGAWGKAPRRWEVSENFCIKSNLTVSKVTFNCKLQKKMGSMMYYLLPQ